MVLALILQMTPLYCAISEGVGEEEVLQYCRIANANVNTSQDSSPLRLQRAECIDDEKMPL